MKKCLSLQNDHYLRVLIEFTLYSLIVAVLLNIPNIYIYLKYGSCLILMLYILMLPCISFIIYILRFSIISNELKKSDNAVGILKRIFEKGKGWYEYKYDNLEKVNGLINLEEITKEKVLRNAIERASNIQGIEYLYRIKNDDDNDINEIIRTQYFRGVSSIVLINKVYNKNNINIKINRNNKTKAYII